MRHVKRSRLERGLIGLLCMVMLLSFLPEVPLTAFAAEESEVTGETDDTLTHQTIRTAPDDSGSGQEQITLDGLMPPHAEVSVQPCDALPAEHLCAYDISITDANGDEFQPETGTSIQVRIENPAIGEAAAQEQNLRLWHIGDDGVREEIQHFRIRGDSIVFDATGFSIYEVDNGTPPLRTYYFKIPTDPANNTDYQLYYFPTTGVDAGGHNKMICQQTIKNGEVPIFPQLPADISSRYTFMGWYRWENGTLSDTPFDFSQIDPVTENETVILHAVFRSCVYAIFHDQYNGKSRNFPIMATRRGCLSAASGKDVYGNPADALAAISLKDLYVVYDDEEQEEGTPPCMAFMGWTIIPPQYAVSNDTIREYTESNDVEVIKGDTIQISGTTRLYPVFEPICWLEFNTNQQVPKFVPEGQTPRTYVGATYKPPLYFSSDDGFRFDEGETPQSAPICAGYEFQGWYTAQGVQVTDADLNLISGLNTDEIEVRNNRLYFKQISGQPKVHQVDLYAKWERDQSTYTVVVWRQKESDDKNATEKTYDFAESHTFNNVMTEDLVSVADQFKNLTSSEYTGFYYASCDSTKEVAGNGSTVLNVYYDRCTVTYQFYNSYTQAGRPNATPLETWDGLYGQKIAKYGYEWKSSDAWYYYKGDNKGITYLEAFNSITSTYSDYNATSHQYTTKIYQNGSNSSYQIIHVFQGLDGTYDLSRSDLVYTTNVPTEKYTFSFTNKFEGFLVYGYSKGNFTSNPPNNAADENEADPGDRDKSVSVYQQNLYVYHKRRSHELKFVDSKNSGTEYKTVNVLYQQPLTGYPPTDPDTPPKEGDTFSGWFYDLNCSSGTRVDFDALTMPNANMIVYAGWETEWFKVEIDPNGGVLTGTQATWFWEPFNGDPIEEYKTVTRNYEPDAYGDYYYALRNRDYYHLGEEWDPREDTDYKTQIVNGYCTRGAFYTTDINLASDATRYRAADSAYRYLGWYEVDPVTGEEKPYHFGTHITKNTYLKLHWKQLGTYFISYHAGIGTIDNQDKNEQTFEFLDADDYADHADVVVTRVAIAPKGKNFVGWRIRTDPTGTIYYPGQSFRFSSSYAVTTSELDENGQIVVKRNIVLDAVYQDIDNAKILYDPNGGTVDTRALVHAGGQDASRAPAVETDGSPYPLTTDVQIQDNRLVVSDLLNNTAVMLADGVGFTNPGYTFVGWSTSKNGIGGTDYEAGSVRCYADNKDTVILYAQWEFRVYYDKNNANAPNTLQGWGGDWQAAGYGWDPVKQLYYTTLRLGAPASHPEAIPISVNDEEMFKYWSVKKQETIGVMKPPFDFAQPITQELVEQYAGSYTDSAGNSHKQLTLYGCWDAPIRIPVHIVDTSSLPWELRDDWLQDGVTDIILRHDEISLASAADALNYADGNKLNGMTFAFACTAGNQSADVQTISDERTITSIWYDAEDMRVKVRYPDGSVHDFDTSAQTQEAVYLVYYTERETVPIHYENMSLEGVLTAVSPLSSSALLTAEITGDSYAMQNHVVRPCAWAASSDNTPQYYSFAIGSPDASDASGLQIITDYAESDTSRPVLYLRQTWQGLAYSLDGTEWREGGYGQHLYVIYYEQRPTVVNLTEHTIGLPEDMADTFDYQITVTLSRTRTVERRFYTKYGNYYWPANGYDYPTISQDYEETSDSPVQTVTLGDHDVKSIVLFYVEIPDSMDTAYHEYTVSGNTTIYYRENILNQKIQQSVTIRQTPNAAYTTVNDAESGDHVYKSDYTAIGSNDPVTITYTNTRRLEKQVHIAIAQSGIIRQTDTLRTSDENLYAHTFTASGDTWELSGISPEQLLNDTTGKYRFAGILLGKEDASGTVTPAPAADAVQSLTFGAVTDTAYGYYLNGDNQRLLNGNDIYFVYYEQPTIRYMLDNPKDRQLIEINPLKKNDSDFTRDGVQIAQNELVPVVPEQETLVSQLSTPSSPAFLIPDLLDHNGKNAALDLAEIGIRNADGSLTRSTRELVYLSYENAALQYHFGTGEPPQPFANDLTVYAIYRIRGCCLTLTKTVDGDAGGADNQYSFTIRSDALNDGAYYIGGYGDDDTITAVDHAITLTIPSGSSVTLYGLAQGSYTVTETTTGIFHVIAKVDGEAVPVMDNTTAFYIGKDTDVEIINLYPIPVTGAGESGTVYLYFLFFSALAAAVLFCRQHFNHERMSTMKKKTMHRVMASMTALMAGIAMTASVYAGAVDSHTIDTPPAHKLETSSVQAEIPINKDIVLFNADELYIHEPNITYTYEIMPANVNNAEIVTKNTTDNNMTTLTVRPGILEAITAISDSGDLNAGMTEGEGKKTGTITFGLDNTTKKKTNREAAVPVNVTLDYKYRKDMKIKVDASKIYKPTGATTPNSPGVYRYKITDVTTADTFTQSGVTDGGAPNTVYLDVYVKNNADNNGFEVYGYVLLRDTDYADDLSITYTEEKVPETVKIEGFVTDDEGDTDHNGEVLPADLKADTYHTFNVHVSKQVVGNLADRNHQFPFKVELTNDIVKSMADFSVNNGLTHTDNFLSAAGKWDSETNKPDGITFQFKHGDVFNFIGLPAGTKIKVWETNDTENTYAISVLGNGTSLEVKKAGSDAVSTSVTAAEGETAEMNAAFAIGLGTTGDQIVVTNTLRDISVTGLLLDIAPFIFITATGVILLAFYMGGRRKNDTENKI